MHSSARLFVGHFEGVESARRVPTDTFNSSTPSRFLRVQLRSRRMRIAETTVRRDVEFHLYAFFSFPFFITPRRSLAPRFFEI